MVSFCSNSETDGLIGGQYYFFNKQMNQTHGRGALQWACLAVQSFTHEREFGVKTVEAMSWETFFI